jgi:iron complex outermembrane receptor protein
MQPDYESIGRWPLLMAVVAAMTVAGLHASQPDDASASGPPVSSASAENPLFEDLPVVEAAALHAQTLEEAPANVTAITAADIRKYGYRTLAEALAGVRGFYVTYDHIYHYVGLSGFSIPGDYNTRFLVMLNGHPLTEHAFDSNGFFGQDFGLDMHLIERIEIIRGPSSALYGSNGILANINIVTQSPVDQPKLRASTENGSFGERKGMLSTSLDLGKGANLLVSASVFNNGGENLYVPEFDSPATNFGRVTGADSERGYHTFANLVWGNWSFTGYFNSREKEVPVAWGDSIFNDPASRALDSRNFVEASYTRQVGNSSELRWKISYDNYRYRDRFDYQDGNAIDDVRTHDANDWLSTQVTYRLPVPKIGDLTVGSEVDYELRNLQQSLLVSPDNQVLASIRTPDRSFALFAQQEWNLSQRFKAYIGARWDDSHNFHSFVSPRIALVYQWSPKTVWKFVYGRPFRNPSTAEQFYNDGGFSSIANPALHQETADTFEVSAEHKLGSNANLVVNLYRYQFYDLIEAIMLPGDIQQYQNTGQATSTGVEVEVNGKLRGRLEGAASLAFGAARDVSAGQALPNSPERIGKLRLAFPFAQNRMTVSSSFQYLSQRQTMSGETTRPVALADFTLTTVRLDPRFDVVCGLRNALNWTYKDPVYVSVDQLAQDGRSFFLKLIWHTVE